MNIKYLGLLVGLLCGVVFGIGDGVLHSGSFLNKIIFSWNEYWNSYPYDNQLDFLKTLEELPLYIKEFKVLAAQ